MIRNAVVIKISFRRLYLYLCTNFADSFLSLEVICGVCASCSKHGQLDKAFRECSMNLRDQEMYGVLMFDKSEDLRRAIADRIQEIQPWFQLTDIKLLRGSELLPQYNSAPHVNDLCPFIACCVR